MSKNSSVATEKPEKALCELYEMLIIEEREM